LPLSHDALRGHETLTIICRKVADASTEINKYGALHM
jgi:hypothetical protein